MPSIPPVPAYPLPTAGQLPDEVLTWTAKADRAVVLVHDMQKYFLRPFPPPLRDQLVANTARVVDRARDLGVPIAYSLQPGSMTSRERGLLVDVWGPGMEASEHDRPIVEPIAPRPGDWQLTKWRYSAFVRSDLLERLRAHDRDQLVLCGVYAHVGVLMTAAHAFQYDIQPFVVADATGDFSERHHRWALEYAAQRCAVVTTSEEVLT